MCDMQALSATNSAFIQDVPMMAQKGLEQVRDGATFFYGRFVELLTDTSNVTAKIFKSPPVFKDTISGFVNLVNATHIFKKVIVSQKALETADVLQEFISAIRIIESLDYFVTGKFQGDFAKGLHFKIAAEACFLFCRIGDTALWAAKHKLIELGSIATATSSVSVFGRAVIQVSAMTPILLFAIGGMICFAIEDIKVLARGEQIAYRIAGISNSAVGCVLLSCIIIGGFHPLILASLGVASAGTAILSFILEPPAPRVV